VAKGLYKLHGKDSEVDGTIKFIDMFNNFFDCLNVCHFDAGKHGKNSFKSPYGSKNDFRLQVCMYMQFIGRHAWYNAIIVVRGRVLWIFTKMGAECQ